MPPPAKPRLAVRALILHQDRLLLVNAWPQTGDPGGQSDLWCAPGGGVEANTSLPDNLMREVMEETGLTVAIGPPVLVNEFHDPALRFHQVDIYFRCTITGGTVDADWTDPEGVVTRRRFFARPEMAAIRYKPDSLPDVAWEGLVRKDAMLYDPLEPILR
jgi:8-oxo-dGTP diphosphatase